MKYNVDVRKATRSSGGKSSDADNKLTGVGATCYGKPNAETPAKAGWKFSKGSLGK